MGEFSPVQLDALEDALEDLELSGIPAELEADDAVGERLSEYRGLLQLSREALPPVEVPAGALDGVLALARDEAAEVTSVPAEPAEETAPWWKRLSLWIPMLAVGASAALVLVLVRGTLLVSEPEAGAIASADKSEEDMRRPEASAAKPLLEEADELQAAAEPAAEGDGLELGGDQEMRGRLRGSAAAERPASEIGKRDDGAAFGQIAEVEEEAEAEDVPAAPEPTDKVFYEESSKGEKKDAPKTKAKPKKTSGSKGSSSKSSPAKPSRPAPTPSQGADAPPTDDAAAPGGGGGGSEPSQQRAAALTAAERDRKAGRCADARPVYTAALDDAEDSVRAKALAGLGLCALAAGDAKGAEAYFARAKKADASIGPFIARERRRVEAQSL